MKKNKISYLCALVAFCILLSALTVFTAQADSLFVLKDDSTLHISQLSDGTKIVTGLPEKVLLSSLLFEFQFSDDIYSTKNDQIIYVNEVVSTGVLLTLGYEELYVVIKGDTNGDGIITATDYLQVKSYFLGTYELEGIFFKAADCAENGIIDATDYLQMKRYFIGEFDLYPDYIPSEESSEIPSEESSEASFDVSVDVSEESSSVVEETYILNIKNKKIHLPTCNSVKTMSEENKLEYTGDINYLLADGYVPCGSCKPGQTEESSEEVTDDSSEPSTETPSEESSEVVEPSTEDSSEDITYTYILNTKSKKIHLPSCSGAATISEANRQEFNGDLNELISQGYKACGTCKPTLPEESSEEISSSEESSSEDTSSEDTTETPFEIVTVPEVEKAYKFALNQTNLGNPYYFTGGMANYYLATTIDSMSAVDVFLENAEGGYYLYFEDESVKNYINIVEREDSPGKVTIKLEKAASTVYTFNSELNILIANVVGADYYLGTYNSYNTISASQISYITGDNADKIGVSQFPAYLVTLK